MFLVTYDGCVSGSLGGRDDGQPETKQVICATLAQAGAYVDQPGFQVYQCVPLPAPEARTAAQIEARQEQARRQAAKQQSDRQRLAELSRQYPDG